MRTFRKGVAADADVITGLVNAASNGDGGRAGWTHENDLMAGERIDIDEIRGLLAEDGMVFLITPPAGTADGCVLVHKIGEAGYFGLLSVRPALQTGGVGTALLAEAERVLRDELGCPIVEITVMTSHRHELTAWYERRGYTRTGRFKKMARKGAAENAKRPGLMLEWLTKRLDPVSE